MSESYLTWDPAQVSHFIDGVEPDSGKLFLDHNIDGSLLPYLTTDHLKEVGITKIGSRLAIKRAISELIVETGIDGTTYPINNNAIGAESLTLSTKIMRDMFKQLAISVKQSQPAPAPSPISPTHQLDMKRLNENFNKLKADLVPVIKYMKETKPLPTPTLDPGPTTLYLPTNSVLSAATTSSLEVSPAMTASIPPSVSRSNSTTTSIPMPSTRNSSLPSPTMSNRFSSGSILSLGTGKIVLQTVPESGPGSRLSQPEKTSSRPRLIQTKSANSTTTTSTLNTLKPSQPSTSQLGTTSNEPLKQLRASSDDLCYKVLQHAMKRHHIPRDDWLKYVLVICYGDKERILKLQEKPVVVFKELQELGKHPAIMLRQLATSEDDDNQLYEDSRIGDDIPGGTL